MSDTAFTGGAAPAAPASAPAGAVIDTNATQLPPPAETRNIPGRDEVSEGQPPSGAQRKSIEQSIKDAHARAFDEKGQPRDKPLEKPKPAEAKPDARAKPEAEAKPQPQRGEGGRFASTKPQGEEGGEQQQATAASAHPEPPRRFAPASHADWANTPESIRVETHRAVREMEAGFAKYKADAEAYNNVRDFDQYARKMTNGDPTAIRRVLTNYATLENMITNGDLATKLDALERVAQRGGLSLREVAQHILDQPPEAVERTHRAELQRLQNEINTLKQTMNGVVTTQRSTAQAALLERVTGFATQNPRFDELSNPALEHNIQTILASGLVAKDLPPHERLAKAYELADRLNPGGDPPASLKPKPQATAAPTNGAGSRSIAGAPASGSDPRLPAPKKKGDRPTIHDAVKRARARAGV